MNVAVTGASGFIGHRVTSKLLMGGLCVTALSRRLPANDFVEHDRFRWIEWDLCDNRSDSFAEALAGTDCIVHLAAYIPEDQRDPSEARRCLEANALGTLNLINASENAGIRRFIYISAGQLYGCSDSAVDERHPIDLTSRAVYYLSSKLVGEMYVQHMARCRKMEAVILRVGSVYGPGMTRQATVPRLIESVIGGRTIKVVNEGRYGVDLVYVDDVVSCVLRAVSSAVQGIYNVGSGTRTTFRELLAAILKLCPEASPPLEYVSSPDTEGFAPLDITKARVDLGYQPLALEEGLTRTIDAIREPEAVVAASLRARKGEHG